MSRLFTSGDQSIGASVSASVFQWTFRVDFLWDWLVWSPCSSRNSQESSPTPQSEGISSSALSFFYGWTFTSVYDYWKNHSFDYTHLRWQSGLCSLICCLGLSWEKAMAPHFSTLAWRVPWMEEPGRLQSMGSLGVEHDWATSLSLFTFMHWRRKWQPTPVLLPGESPGRGSLVGCHLWGCTESDMTEAT